MKLNTNNNVYTICYAAVMVIIVAFLLAFVASALKETLMPTWQTIPRDRS